MLNPEEIALLSDLKWPCWIINPHFYIRTRSIFISLSSSIYSFDLFTAPPPLVYHLSIRLPVCDCVYSGWGEVTPTFSMSSYVSSILRERFCSEVEALWWISSHCW